MPSYGSASIERLIVFSRCVSVVLTRSVEGVALVIEWALVQELALRKQYPQQDTLHKFAYLFFESSPSHFE